MLRVRYRETTADNLGNAGWSWGCVSGVGSRGRTCIAATKKHFVVRADERPLFWNLIVWKGDADNGIQYCSLVSAPALESLTDESRTSQQLVKWHRAPTGFESVFNIA